MHIGGCCNGWRKTRAYACKDCKFPQRSCLHSGIGTCADRLPLPEKGLMFSTTLIFNHPPSPSTKCNHQIAEMAKLQAIQPLHSSFSHCSVTHASMLTCHYLQSPNDPRRGSHEVPHRRTDGREAYPSSILSGSYYTPKSFISSSKGHCR